MTLSTTGAASQGLVYLTLTGVDASGRTFTEQGSGVLLSGDEVLTAAHLVYNRDGTLRTAGLAAVGYGGGAALATSAVDGVQVEAERDYTTVDGMGHDVAVVHLSAPVANGTLFSLGSDLASGTFDVGGYPAGTPGALDTRTETLAVASGTEVYTGGALDDGAHDPAGSSGGSVYRVVGGAPTAYGVVSADLSGDTSQGFFKELTAADVAEIRSLVAAADAAPAVAHAAPGFSVDIATALAADAAGHAGPAGAVMADVAAAIAAACRDGGTFAQMAQDAASDLAATSSYAKRAVAYLAGLLSGTTGTWLGDVPRSAEAVVGGSVSGALRSRAAAAGRAEGLGLGAPSTSAALDPASAALAGAIAAGGAPHGAVRSLRPTNADLHGALAIVAHHGQG